jgi:hypothetical protein
VAQGRRYTLYEAAKVLQHVLLLDGAVGVVIFLALCLVLVWHSGHLTSWEQFGLLWSAAVSVGGFLLAVVMEIGFALSALLVRRRGGRKR